MRWIENITIYSTASIQNKKIIRLLTQFTYDESYPSPERIAIYRHSKLKNELVILIYWESDSATTNKSTLGLRLAETFKEFGMINHYVWLEGKLF